MESKRTFQNILGKRALHARAVLECSVLERGIKSKSKKGNNSVKNI